VPGTGIYVYGIGIWRQIAFVDGIAERDFSPETTTSIICSVFVHSPFYSMSPIYFIEPVSDGLTQIMPGRASFRLTLNNLLI
jgi:hypothetical protein